MRMGVVKPDDVETASPRLPPGVDVIFRIDQKSVGVCRKVSGPASVGDDVGGPKQETATFGRRGLARVGDGGVQPGLADDHSASMIIAMPMPPPMHNAATP